jgi:hypothetical protein
MGYDSIDHVLCDSELHQTLRNELHEKIRAAGKDHGSPIRDILAMQGSFLNIQVTWVESAFSIKFAKYLCACT